MADCPNEQSGGAFIRNSAKDIYKHSAAPISSSSTTIGTSTASNASTGTCARHSRQWKVCENHQKQHNITSSNFDHWYFNQALTAAATTQNYLSPYSSHVSTQGEPEEQLMISVQSLPENNSRGYNMNKQINRLVQLFNSACKGKKSLKRIPGERINIIEKIGKFPCIKKPFYKQYHLKIFGYRILLWMQKYWY